MAQEEVFGTRDRTYSAWHRRLSTRRFVGIECAQSLAMIDLDAALYVEYDDKSKEPLALVETALDIGQDWKPASVTKRLARRCNPTVSAFALLYRPAKDANPADPNVPDIAAFRVRRIWPEPETPWVDFTPSAWAEYLVKLRRERSGELDAHATAD